jgi:hypothetical protein
MRNQLTVPAAIDHQARDKVGRASHNHVGNQANRSSLGAQVSKSARHLLARAR